MLNSRSIGGAPRLRVRHRLHETRWLLLLRRRRCICGARWPCTRTDPPPTPAIGAVHPPAPWGARSDRGLWFSGVPGFVAPPIRKNMLVEAADVSPLLAPGDVIWVPEHAHHGAARLAPGELRLRVTKTPPDLSIGSDWVELDGYRIQPDGTEAQEESWHLVRLSQVRVSLNPPEAGA